MAFLIVAVFASAFVTYGVVWYYRRPKSIEQGIEEFSRGLSALAPPSDDPPPSRARRRERR